MGAFLDKLVGGKADKVLELNYDGPAMEDEDALHTFQEAQQVLEVSTKWILFLRSYHGNEDLVRKAMSNPSNKEIRAEAFRGMFPNIEAIRDFYQMSKAFGAATSEVVNSMLDEEEFLDQIYAKPSITTSLAMLFENVYLFDWAKMNQPSVQNDFSFYRRELNQNANSNDLPVDDADASAISMFIAQSNPLLYSIENVLSDIGKRRNELAPLLANFVNACSASIMAGKQTSQKDIQTLHLSMVIGVLLFDRIDSHGAFAKGSPIDLKRVLLALKSWKSEFKDSAMSTLHYSSKTFNQAPIALRKLFP